MDFDSFGKLIPLLFLILWSIMSAIGKKKKKKERAENQKKESKPFFRGPLVGKLQDSLNKIFEELEPKTDQEIPEPLTSFIKKSKESAKSELKKTAAANDTPPESRPQEEKPSEKKVRPILEHASKKAAIPKSKLRVAVIWSEILAQPVGLRDE